MRLKCIRLAGFKSFVNPTTIHFPANICAIVGPNGCGKSNVIDAVRWVMGESSARNLRGGQMADVIFDGTTERSAVGLASVELVLDNSDQRLRGEYAGYAEISIKRKVERGGDSEYQLNGARCRRRDITELFLGTGLGPRSYSIVEQGMVSRLIESRPEELRVFIEEAAGISKYRERRRETAARIARTRDNLERLADRRAELKRQLQHLDRQSRAAQRYREWMEDQRSIEARVHALRWQALAKELEVGTGSLASLETEKEAITAQQREEEAGIEKSRQENAELASGVNEIQGRSIQIGNDIVRIEQSIKHRRESLAQLEKDLAETRGDWRQTADELDADLRQVTRIESELEQVAGAAAEAAERERASSGLALEAEQRQRQSQQSWDAFSERAQSPRQVAEVEQARIRQLRDNIDRARQRRERLQAELGELDTGPGDFASRQEQADGLEQAVGELRGRQSEAAARIDEMRKRIEACGGEFDRVRAGIRQAAGRLASLEALQQAALGDDDDLLAGWLERHGLAGRARLGESLRIEPGWEAAVELVLGDLLRGIPVDELPESLAGDLPGADLTLLDGNKPQTDANPGRGAWSPLASKLGEAGPVGGLLRGIHAVDSVAEALAGRKILEPGESLVAAEGVWASVDWVRVGKADSGQSVVLRQGAIDALRAEIESLERKSAALADERGQCRESLSAAEKQREDSLDQMQRKTTELNRIRAEIDAERSRIKGNIERAESIREEFGELDGQIADDLAGIEEAEQRLRGARKQMSADAGRQREFAEARERDRELLAETRGKAERDRETLHQLALKKHQLDAQLKSTRENMDRMAVQVQRLAERIRALETGIGDAKPPTEALRAELEEKLAGQSHIEGELQRARAAYEKAERQLQSREQALKQLRQRFNGIAEDISRLRVENERAVVMSEELLRHLRQAGRSPREVLEDIPEGQTVESCEEELAKLKARIERIGPVNLAAAEEFKQQSEQKIWLDKQNDELEKALATLENAMRKIDGETRSRFGDTLEQINQGLKDRFARLFRGGQAWLELTGEDLLNAGVSIMARPPGKKIQGIMQLSGGEKAMTAIALVFTIFQLNPSPFCMLDEVDAPLDVDNNNRFIALLREMAETVQFILVTHKTITMESANQLLGITMQEAGISRTVSVDLDEAAEMAQA